MGREWGFVMSPEWYAHFQSSAKRALKMQAWHDERNGKDLMAQLLALKLTASPYQPKTPFETDGICEMYQP